VKIKSQLSVMHVVVNCETFDSEVLTAHTRLDSRFCWIDV